MSNVAVNPNYEEPQRESDASIANGHHPFTRLQLFNECNMASACSHEFLMATIRIYNQNDCSERLDRAELAILEFCQPYLDFAESYIDCQFCIETVIDYNVRYDRWGIRLFIHLSDAFEYESFLALMKLHTLPEWQSLDIK